MSSKESLDLVYLNIPYVRDKHMLTSKSTGQPHTVDQRCMIPPMQYFRRTQQQ